jgi:hypothetical protein
MMTIIAAPTAPSGRWRAKRIATAQPDLTLITRISFRQQREHFAHPAFVQSSMFKVRLGPETLNLERGYR